MFTAEISRTLINAVLAVLEVPGLHHQTSHETGKDIVSNVTQSAMDLVGINVGSVYMLNELIYHYFTTRDNSKIIIFY
jgi:hypothetical protein